MRRLLFVLCCTAATLSAQQSRAMIGLAGWRDKFPIEDVTLPFTLDAPKDKAFAAVKSAYEDLNLTVGVNDPAAGTIGIQRIAAQTTFAGFRMSRLFDCGTNGTGAANADTYRLNIVFLSLIDAQDASHTKLRIGVVANGVPNGGSTAQAVQCGSTGMLEQKLADLAAAHVK
jgi:hypothetical protein